MEDTFQTYEEVVMFLEWLNDVRGQVYFVDWTKLTVRYNQPFIKELDTIRGMLHYYTATGDDEKA